MRLRACASRLAKEEGTYCDPVTPSIWRARAWWYVNSRYPWQLYLSFCRTCTGAFTYFGKKFNPFLKQKKNGVYYCKCNLTSFQDGAFLKCQTTWTKYSSCILNILSKNVNLHLIWGTAHLLSFKSILHHVLFLHHMTCVTWGQHCRIYQQHHAPQQSTICTQHSLSQLRHVQHLIITTMKAIDGSGNIKKFERTKWLPPSMLLV